MRMIRENRYAITIGMLLLCYYQFCVGKLYGFSIFPDEFGYWAYAANAAGKEWSDIMSLGSFYSCGYSVILFPIFVLCKNPVTAYREAIFINFLFLCSSYGLLCRIVAEEWENKGISDQREKCQIIAGIAVFYPALIFYAQMTLTETLLFFLFLLLVRMMQGYAVYSSYGRIFGIIVLNCCMYLVHLRTVGVFAVSLCLILFGEYRAERNVKKITFTILSAALLLTSACFFRQFMVGELYREQDSALYHINTYSGQYNNLKYIIHGGFLPFIKSLCGKMLYLGVAGYGMAYAGIIYSAKKIHRGWKRETVLYLFLLLSVISQILISSIYNVMPDTCDSITYGRYHDYVIPVCMVFGMEELAQGTLENKREICWISIGMLVLTLITIQTADSCELEEMKGYFMAGMSLWRSDQMNAALFYGTACLFAIFLMVLFAMLLSVCKRKRWWYLGILGIVLQLCCCESLGKQYLHPFNRLAYQDICLTDQMLELTEDGEHDSFLTYVDYNEISAIGLIQFALRDTRIRVIGCEDVLLRQNIGEQSVVLLGADTPVQGELEQLYDRELISGHFVLLFNE